jgi:SAM-dependent methyltransferase
MDWPYEIAERDHEIQNPTSAEKILLLGSYLRLTAESRVLDVACGKGGPAAILAAAYGCRITGVEIRPEFATPPASAWSQRASTGWWRSGPPTGRGSSSSPTPSTPPSASAPPLSGDR